MPATRAPWGSWFVMTAGTVYSGPQWQHYATADTDEAHAFVRRAFIDVNVTFAGDGPGGTSLQTAGTALGGIGVVRMLYRAPTRLLTVPDGDLNVTHVLSGRVKLANSKNEHHVRAGEVLILPDHGQTVTFDDWSVFTVRLPRPLIETVAQAQTGITGADLRFDDSRPITEGLGRHWTHTVNHVLNTVLCDPELMANPLITANASHLLAATALAVFPNTSLDARQQPAGDVTPQVLRRAMAYIDEHAHRPVTMSEMAAAAGVSARALQLAFRRHRDTTPTRYARTVRLERAHRDLQNADPTSGITIAAIANRWGFPHLGRFSTDYRAAYGTTPSHTLRT
jgi:AraC-like DNA-binding protein